MDQLEHICTDEKKNIEQLLEEGMTLVLKNRKKKIPEEFITIRDLFLN
jgi:hypothetical protein